MLVKQCSVVSLFFLLFFSSFVFSDSLSNKGLEIIQKVEARDRGWGDSSANLEMILSNKHGQKSVRKLSIKNLEIDGDGDKSLTVFDQPRDVKGTAFLSFSHSLKADEQWLYLPALKRVKRISSNNKSGPFLGSEFAFEDLASFEVEKYDYEFIREEKIKGVNFAVITMTPRYKHSGYSFQNVWVNLAEYRIEKTVFYDRKKSKLKTLVFLEYKKYLDTYWRSHSMVVNNHQTGKATELRWDEYRFKTGLSDKDFNKNTLKRAR